MRSFSFTSAWSKPSPASTDTQSRSSTFGSSARIRSLRPRMRLLITKSGAMKPIAAPIIAIRNAKAGAIAPEIVMNRPNRMNRPPRPAFRAR